MCSFHILVFAFISSLSIIQCQNLTEVTLNITTVTEPDRLTLIEEFDGVIETKSNVKILERLELFNELTKTDVYDKRIPPKSDGPIKVEISISVNALGAIATRNTERDSKFRSQLSIYETWKDPRLAFANFSTNQILIRGEDDFAKKIWRPNIIVANEASSSLINVPRSNNLITIYPDGRVVHTFRVRSETYCALYMHKFPFDKQRCSFYFESWSLTDDKLLLEWKKGKEIEFNDEYTMIEFFKISHDTRTLTNTRPDGQKYSMLDFEIYIGREYGFFVIDFYVPGVIIVFMSWVAFWIDPASIPGRINIGIISTFAFITLRRLMTNQLPRVGYFKALDGYSATCLVFIIATLVEFGFVNTVWRRTKELQIKKLSATSLFKSAITPSASRRPSLSPSMMTSSVNDLNQSTIDLINEIGARPRARTLTNDLQQRPAHHMSSSTLTTISCNSCPDLQEEIAGRHSVTGLSTFRDDGGRRGSVFSLSSARAANDFFNKQVYYLEQREAGKYIDRRARIYFPLLFGLFNIVYWIWVFAL